MKTIDTLKVEIVDFKANVKDFTWTDADTGEIKEGRSGSQLAYLHTGGKYPEKFYIDLAGKENEKTKEIEFKPFPIGEYELTMDNFYLDNFKRLKIRKNLILKKLPG